MQPTAPAILIRPITPEDAAPLQAFHRGLSVETVRNRFFGFHRELTDREARRFTSLAAASEVGLVATADGVIVAVGRYVRLGDGTSAEVAFVVDDLHQHHGIGRDLLRALASIGRASGVRRFVADTFVSNVAMLATFNHTPDAVSVLSTRRDGSTVHLVLELTAK